MGRSGGLSGRGGATLQPVEVPTTPFSLHLASHLLPVLSFLSISLFSRRLRPCRACQPSYSTPRSPSFQIRRMRAVSHRIRPDPTGPRRLRHRKAAVKLGVVGDAPALPARPHAPALPARPPLLHASSFSAPSSPRGASASLPHPERSVASPPCHGRPCKIIHIRIMDRILSNAGVFLQKQNGFSYPLKIGLRVNFSEAGELF